MNDLKKMNISPGFSEQVFDALAVRTQHLCDLDKSVVLVFDEMAIKEALVYNGSKDEVDGFEDFDHMGKTKYIANHASVFMVRGLAGKWKQPVGYFLSSGPINSGMLQILTRTCLTKLFKIGLKVVALVCDQGSNNRSFLHQLEGVLLEKLYINCTGQKVFVFFDPPHLLKNVRNNLKRNNLVVSGKSVKW